MYIVFPANAGKVRALCEVVEYQPGSTENVCEQVSSCDPSASLRGHLAFERKALVSARKTDSQSVNRMRVPPKNGFHRRMTRDILDLARPGEGARSNLEDLQRRCR